MPKSSPTVRQRRLAAELRRLRKHTDLSAEDIAARLSWSPAKVYRTEAGQTLPPIRDIAALLDVYGVDDVTRAALMELAREARRRGWWAGFTDVLSTAYVSLEDEASRIQAYEAHVVHGLFQTDEYARAIFTPGDMSPENIERKLQARMARKTAVDEVQLEVPPATGRAPVLVRARDLPDLNTALRQLGQQASEDLGDLTGVVVLAVEAGADHTDRRRAAHWAALIPRSRSDPVRS